MLIYVTHQIQTEHEYEKDINPKNDQGKEFMLGISKEDYLIFEIIIIGETITISL